MTLRGYNLSTLEVALFFLLILVLSGGTVLRNDLWKDGITLWQDTVEKSPFKARPHNNLAMAYYRRGYVDEAIEGYLKALSIANLSQIHANLGVAYLKKGLVDKAIEEERLAIELDPYYAPAYSNLGIAYSTKGMHREAIESFRKALALRPRPLTRHNLAKALRRAGHLEEARRELEALLELSDVAE